MMKYLNHHGYFFIPPINGVNHNHRQARKKEVPFNIKDEYLAKMPMITRVLLHFLYFQTLVLLYRECFFLGRLLFYT